jgi:integrase
VKLRTRVKKKSKGSLDNYHAVTEHLKAYKAYTKKRIDFDTIDLNFFYSYVDYLKKVKKLADNTIAKDISIIKVFMGEAVDMGYTDNFAFRNKKFTYSEVETDQIYLNEQELDKIYKHTFSNKKLENTRDLFMFGAWTMLRFSDFTNVKPENIVEIDDQKFIKIITQKTKELVIIPCNPVILEILEKYKDNTNSLPKSISNQKFNKYIKDVCKEVGLNEIGRNSDMPLEPLWNLVSAHTCRRSGITNYFLQDFPKYYLQKISGHKTERQFDKYLRVTKLDTAKRLREHIDNIDWTRLLLKATTS